MATMTLGWNPESSALGSPRNGLKNKRHFKVASEFCDSFDENNFFLQITEFIIRESTFESLGKHLALLNLLWFCIGESYQIGRTAEINFYV